MSLWQDVRRLREVLLAFGVALLVGFGLGRRRYREDWQRRL